MHVWVSHLEAVADGNQNAVQGINAYVESTSKLPIEFILLQYRPGRFTSVPTHFLLCN